VADGNILGYFPAALVAFGVLIAGIYAERVNYRESESGQRLVVSDRLAVVRAHLEGNINGNVQLIEGLASMVSLEPNMTQERFAAIARPLFHGHPELRNVDADPDMVIRLMYPLAGNEAAIGLDYRTNAAQWEAAERARISEKVVLAGPVNLVQGGEGLVGRIPVFLDPASNGQKRFWGLISTVIDIEWLYRASGLRDDGLPLEIAIRGKDALGENGDNFFGRPGVFLADPVLADVALPYGHWQMAAIPKEGWPQRSENTWTLRIVFLLGGILVVFPVGFIGHLLEWRRRDLETLRWNREIQSLAAETSGGFLMSTEPERSFAKLLDGIILITGSKFGFLGHVRTDGGGGRTFDTRAITNIAWDDETRAQAGNVPSLDFANLDPLFGHTLRTGESAISENLLINSGRRSLIHPPLVSCLSMPLFFEGRMIGMVGIANSPAGYDQDLVDGMGAVWAAAASILHAAQIEEARRRAVEAAESANRAKSEFLSNMSHELRTPLNAVIGFAQMLEGNPREPLSAQQQKCVDRILKGGQHLLDLITEILDLSTIEAGRVDLLIEDVVVAGLLEECGTLIQSLATRRGVRVNLGSAEGLVVKADYTRLTQVLLNLLSNAIKYNRPEGGVDITCAPTEDGQVVLSVADTGLGIPEDKRGELFKPFTRLGQENAGIEGTGIGLTITKRLVELMGGAIDFDSVVGQGSTFRVTLPRSEAKAPVDQDHSAASGPQAQGLRGTVLYVEDNPANLDLMEMVFMGLEGARLLTASTGELGIELAREHRPDLILLDLHLPGVDGFEVLRQLRGMEETRHIPVFAMTAAATRRDMERGSEAGFDRYLTKPFIVADLLNGVRDVLKDCKTK
jgi:sensor domain CHASE-containing protein/CheY-like chemotaxis protein/nitrogen-specific signal transduction histidine kinase